MKIIHEKKKCIGCGLCATICPKFWEMTDEGKSQLLNSKKNGEGNYEIEVDDVACNQEAADSCPAQCIKVA
jgi:ferredoxin